MAPKISIIVPVYNVEKYLRKCIDSILTQTYSNWELLLIDDGSPDRSGKICDKYVDKDSRIRIFHKPNGGVSSARNLGLDNARGDYVTFIDADDWLPDGSLDVLINSASGYDIVRGCICDVMSENPPVSKRRSYKTFSSKEEFQISILIRETYLGVCGGVYKKSLFDGVRFDSQLSCGEDWLVLWQLVVRSNRINLIDHICYCYNKTNEASVTSVFQKRKFTDTIDACNRIYDSADKNLRYYRQTTVCDIRYHFLFLLLTMNCSSKALKEYYDYVMEYTQRDSLAYVLKSKKSKGIRLFLILNYNYRLFSLNRKLYHLWKRIR